VVTADPPAFAPVLDEQNHGSKSELRRLRIQLDGLVRQKDAAVTAYGIAFAQANQMQDAVMALRRRIAEVEQRLLSEI
jgi:hypothetical protein